MTFIVQEAQEQLQQRLWIWVRHFIKTDISPLLISQEVGLHRETVGSAETSEEALYSMDFYERMFGESTFYSQFIGFVRLEHYYHYMGSNTEDIAAAGTTIPKGVGNNGSQTGTSESPKERWQYWLQRTTPKMFVYKCSATPLFHFDLIYAERLGIFNAFTDPDPGA
jgi:hypothetical protein